MLSGINFILFNLADGRKFLSLSSQMTYVPTQYFSHTNLSEAAPLFSEHALIIINCSIKCWNLWPTLFKDEMQQTDTLCGQIDFSGASWQDVTRDKEQGIPVTSREMLLGK